MSTEPESRVGRTLTHYLLEARLGIGGMGEVYRARDLALGRLVALKLLRDVPGTDAQARADLKERLIREARASARLQHPSIATFHEAGEVDGIVFLALELVPGETLRARLLRGPLAAAEAIAVASALLEALAHAHAAGLVHRDLKPENVMLVPGGGVKLLDFGLALPIDPSELPGAATRLTGHGFVVGTPGYMAPEQMRGESADAATDLFALGAVLHEMLAGRPALDAQGRAVSALPPDTPPALAQVVAVALDPDPMRRPKDAFTFLRALRAVDTKAATGAGALAVLDPVNAHEDPQADWIGGALGESLAAAIATVPGVTLVPRARLARARAEVRLENRGTPPADEARAVGLRVACRWLLSGRYGGSGERLEVELRLVDVTVDEVVHVERIEGAISDLFTLEDRLAAALRRALARRAAGRDATTDTVLETRPREAADSARLRAYRAAVRGRMIWTRLQKSAFEDARASFEEAIRLDPTAAAPHAGLASIHAMRFTFRTDPAELAAAEGYARRAIELDAKLADPHVWLCYVLARQWRLEPALAEARMVSELDPRHPHGPYFGGCVLIVQRRLDEAAAWLQRSLDLESTFGFAWLALGWAHLESGRFDEAAWCLDQARHYEVNPINTGPTAGVLGYRGEVERRRGNLGEARRLAMEGLAHVEATDHMYRDTFRGFALATLGRTALDQGDREGARAAFAQLAAHVEGRDRTLGGGHYLVQALAGRAAAGEGREFDEAARALFARRERYDWSWMWGSMDVDSEAMLARAKRALEGGLG